MAWIFPIKGTAVVAESLLQRDLQFRWLSNRDVLSYALGYGVVGVGLAFAGTGVWALVAANLAQGVINTGLLLIHRPPPFSLGVDRPALRELVTYGGGFTAARVANFLALQGDSLVVGRWLGPAALGLYGRAHQLVAMPAGLFGDVLDKVLFPAMARVQDDPVRLAAAYRRGISLIALVMLPASAVLFILAPEVVLVVLGPKWSAVTMPLRVFAVGLLFRTSYKMSDSIARATGAVYRRAWRQAIYALLVFAGALIGQRWGITGVAGGVLLAVTINFLLMAQLSLRLGGGTAREWVGAHVPALKLATLTGLVAWGAVTALRHAELPSGARLLLAGLAAAACWSFLMWVRPAAFLGKEGMWMAQLLRGYLPGRAAAVSGSGG
jgi:PST family polysaccharide transporter